MFKDYYEILNLSPRASGEDVRAAFKTLALQHHPDRAQATSSELVRCAPAIELDASQRMLAPREMGGGAGMPPLSEAALATPSAPNAKDFTDIQEAYEVLGDVARRYLYDMNYQELLLYQAQRRQEEQARREALVRAAEEATRRAHERERHRQQHAQTLHPPRLPAPPPPSTSPPIAEEGEKTEERKLAATTAHAMMDVDLIGGDGAGAVYSSTAPSLGFVHRRGERRGRGRGAARGRGGTSNEDFYSSTMSSSATSSTATRLSSQRYTARSQKVLSAPSTFVITNSISLAAEGEGGSGATTVVARAAGGRPHSFQSGDAERPMAYYHQRSIERTLRVFFDDSKTT